MADPYAPKSSVHTPNAVEARTADAAPEPKPEPEPQPTLQVPDGSVREVNDWVGDDKERAQAALDAEGSDGRKGVINNAKEVLGK